MLLGTTYSTLDDKNRFRINKRHKKEFASDDKLIITKWMDKHLLIMQESEFKAKILDNIDSMAGNEQERYKTLLTLCAACAELEEDSQGRYTMPLELKNYAHIVKEMAMIGMVDRIEIWDKQKKADYESNSINMDDVLLNINRSR